MPGWRSVLGIGRDIVASILVGAAAGLLALAIVLGPAYGAMLQEVASGRATADYDWATMTGAPFIMNLFWLTSGTAAAATAFLLSRRSWAEEPY